MRLLVLLSAVVFTLCDGQRTSQTNRKFRIASIKSAPYLQEVSEGSNQYEGFIVDLLKEMNISFELVTPGDNRYGAADPSGRWSGMVGLAQQKKVDAIAADLTVTKNRGEVLEFTTPFLTSRLSVLSKMGRVSGEPSEVTGMLLAPFTTELWILLVVAYFVSCFTFWLVCRISPYERWPRQESNVTFHDALWFLPSSFFYVSRPAPKAASKRLLLVGWWLFGVVILVSYAVNLRPFLSGTSVYKFRYSSVEDMVNDESFKISFVPGGSTSNLLENSPDPLHRSIYEKAMQQPKETWPNSYREMMEKMEGVTDGHIGLVVEETTAEFFMARNCDLYTVGDLAQRNYAIALPKGSTNKKLFNDNLMDVMESGRMQSIKTKWWPKSECSKSQVHIGQKMAESAVAAIGIEPLSGSFIFLLVFLVVAFLLALCELMYSVYFAENKTTSWTSMYGQEMKVACCGCFGPKSKSGQQNGQQTKTVKEAEDMPTEPCLA